MSVHDIKEAHDRNQLNAHLDSQEMSGEEEAIYDNDLEDALCAIVDEHMLDIESDKLLDALGECKAEWNNFIACSPRSSEPLIMSESLSKIEHGNWAREKFFDALAAKLRVSCLKEAQEYIR